MKCVNGICLPGNKRTNEQIEIDFWKRVKVGPSNRCWPWIAGKRENVPGKDYGIVWISGKKTGAHQFAYRLANGEIPAGMIIRHSCDNPPCCNPSHLLIGTHADNKADCISRNRQRHERGEDRYNSILKESDIIEIRKRYNPRHPRDGGRALANEFSVGKTMISAIVNKHRWKHVQDG